MDMPDEVVVVFGNPRAGTPLMQQDPRIGIELPLRMLVWDRGDAVVLGYNDLTDLARAYDVAGQTATLEAMSSLLAAVARETAIAGQPIGARSQREWASAQWRYPAARC
jgi:uncharacterized protein (DUF302 family)